MKRAILAAVVLCSSALFAQVRGVPASITSLGSRTVAPGASITSLGPNGFNAAPCLFGCGTNAFGPMLNFQNGTFVNGRNFNLHGRRGHHRGAVSGAFVYSYAYPYPVIVVPEETVEPEEEVVEGGGETIYDRRPVVRRAPEPRQSELDDSRYGEHYLDSRERREPIAEEPAPVHHEMTPAPDPEPIVVIFKDGHKKEIKNYAIVGDTLYDLGAVTSHKIKLDEVDLKATVDKNEERGVEFSLPANLKPKA